MTMSDKEYTMSDKEYENMLDNIRAVALSHQGGVPIDRLPRDYGVFNKNPIPFKELGYKSLEAFLRSIPGVVSIQRGSDGQLVAVAVADASTAHLASLISRQKPDTKKKSFRRPPSHTVRRAFSSRYTYRNSYRTSSSYASNSSYTSRNSNIRPISPKRPRSVSPKRPPPSQAHKPSKPAAPIQHSKPSHRSEAAPSSRKYEVAPRFLRLQNQTKSTSPPPPVEEPVPSPSPPPSPRFSEPSFSRPVAHENTWNPIPPPKPCEAIMPPIHPVRPLPNRPKPLENSVSAQMNTLSSIRSAKEYVSMYARLNDLNPSYKTLPCGQKAKNKGFLCTLVLGDSKYYSYPEIRPTKDAAEEEAAMKAKEDIQKKMTEQLNSIPETPYGTAEEIRILLSRIEEIVCEKPSGMYQNGIEKEYESIFKQRLPAVWLDLLRHSTFVEIDEVALTHGRVPKGANFIVRPTKELSSGNQTPSSTSSRGEFPILDTGNLKKSLVEISYPKVPELLLPQGNEWDVYISNVSGEISARLIDYDDSLLDLSNKMAEFYSSNKLPVTNVMEYHIYAACVDDSPDMYHRVLVDEYDVNQDGWLCYFLDEGDFIVIPETHLQEIIPAFLKLPFQAIHLKLEGLEQYEALITEEMLNRTLLEKALVAKVQRSFETPDFFPDIPGINRTIYCVTLYDTTDEVMNVDMNDYLKQEVKASLICKLPKHSSSICGYLSHVTDDGLVYLRCTNPVECWIENQLIQLYPVFEEASASSVGLDVTANSMCVAKCETGTWHRAVASGNQFTSSELDMVEVFFVDYGHNGVIPRNKICALEPISDFLADVPPQALRCELSNALPSPSTKWTQAATNKLLELAPYHLPLIISVIDDEQEDRLAKVNLYKRNQDNDIVIINISLACNPSLFEDPSSSVPAKAPSKLSLQPRQSSQRNMLSNVIPDVAIPAEQMAAKRLGASMSSEELKWLSTPDDIKSPGAFDVQSPKPIDVPVIPNEGEYFDVLVTMAAHPQNFTVQPYTMNKELNQLLEEMQHFYNTEENVFDMDSSVLRKNQYYAALHSDGAWYRVRIEEIMPTDPVTEVIAHYVDYGDFNTVSISNLQPLYQHFKEFPCQAIQASLAGVEPYNSDWDPVDCIEFQKMVTERPFVSVVQKKTCQMKDGIPMQSVELVLIDVSDPDNDVYINKLLITKKIAKPSS